jgi:hypothetical protein
MQKRVALCVMTLIVFNSLLILGASADERTVDELSGKIDEMYSNNTLSRGGRWQKISSVEYRNEGVRERDTLYRSARRLLIVHEVFDSANQESRMFVSRYAASDFGGLINGLSPGMSENAVDRFLGAPYATQGAARAYRNENGMVWVVVSFRNGKSYLLDLHSPPEGVGENQPEAKKIYAQYDQLRRTL